MKHGERVNIARVCFTYKSQRNKIWGIHTRIHKNCIFLGYRTVQTGHTVWDEFEGGYFVPSKYLRVALISINSKSNPIYAPLCAVRRMKGNTIKWKRYNRIIRTQT